MATDATPEQGPLTHEQARAEYAKAQTDPAHPQYDGLRRGTTEANAWADQLYRRVANASDPLQIGNGMSSEHARELSPQEAQEALADVTTRLKSEWGAETESRMAEVKSFIETTFMTTPEDAAEFHELASRFGDDVGAIKLLHKIIQTTKKGK
jgi:hypothetical protein